ncbi:MAG: glycoside hydrolase family 9 protein [Bacteroidota bacterium]
MYSKLFLLIACQLISLSLLGQTTTEYQINEANYYEKADINDRGINVMVFQDFYPDGHQGGVTIMQNGVRVVANGDLRLEPAPGQWSPVPKKGATKIDKEKGAIRVQLWYPDSTKNRKGFNPIIYPDLHFKYLVKVQPEGDGFRVQVDLEEALPDEWYGKAGFNLELFPGFYFGKSYMMDGQLGIFNRQFNGTLSASGDQLIAAPMAIGKKLVVVPENKDEMIVFQSEEGIELIDGRGEHNNGWFIVRSPLQKGKLKNAIDLLITPYYKKDWEYESVIQVSQVGYHSKQKKQAIVELDVREKEFETIQLLKVAEDGSLTSVKKEEGKKWGNFLRYQYLRFDFSDIEAKGIYKIKYGEKTSHPFRIAPNVFDKDVWQPTLAYYLPVQMCHMRINDRYKVWHDWCHLDDALMAPVDLNHFDGYIQGASTLTEYQSGEKVPGVNVGGWHDAGDYDLRVESQATTVMRLIEMQELFGVDYDITQVDQTNKLVEMHRPDGVPDILQQIEHGVMSIVGAYKSMGRLYRGIICPDLRQYTLLGDATSMTDNRFYDPKLSKGELTANTSSIPDDRWIFTEDNPPREIRAATAIAAAYRILKDHNEPLGKDCLELARNYWDKYKDSDQIEIIALAAELLLSTNDKKFQSFLESKENVIVKNISKTAVALAKVADKMNESSLIEASQIALKSYAKEIDEKVLATPFGVEYSPNIWGAGWGIQSFGVKQYFLHRGFPELFSREPVFDALNFVLGVHPGSNNASFVSGVGAKSIIVAYGVNRDEWSYIPGGSVSGTALIRPDFPELKEWPYFWQQTEYVMGGGATNFMFLTLAVKDMLK